MDRLEHGRPVVRVELGAAQTDQRHQQPGQPTLQVPRRERRHRQGFDVLVERGVVMLEGLVVGQVPRPGPVEDRADQPGLGTPDTAGRLDVFRRGLRLAANDHQAQPPHVHADRDHVRGQQHVDGPPLPFLGLGLLLLLPLGRQSPGRRRLPAGRESWGCPPTASGRSVRPGNWR